MENEADQSDEGAGGGGVLSEKSRCTEITEEALYQLLQKTDEQFQDRVVENFCSTLKMTRSPIEQMFVAAYFAETCASPSWVNHRIGAVTADVLLIDYILWNTSDVPYSYEHEEVSVCIELDGHDFHDRNQEQARRDRERDRLLLRDKWIPTVRFTGSEVYRDPFGCVREALEVFEVHKQNIQRLINIIEPSQLATQLDPEPLPPYLKSLGAA